MNYHNPATSQASQNNDDDENLEALMHVYASKDDIRAAVEEKEAERLKDVGILVKDYPNPERELDLHGHSVQEALFEMGKFIQTAIHHKLRTVRIITGRGLHSKNMTSVLPEEIEKKLAELRREGKLLAFKREKTGGSFAVYLIS